MTRPALAISLVIAGCGGAPAPVAAPSAPVHPQASATPAEPAPPKEVPPPRIALVLGGGGARGFAHVGVLRVLEQEKVPLAMVVGTSVGSLIGAMYAADPNAFELEWKAFQIDKEDLFDTSMFATAGLVKGEAIKEFVKANVKIPRIEQFKIPYVAVAADLNTGQRVLFKEGSIVDAVRASVAIPGVFSPAKQANRLLVDGGVVANVAVDVAKELGADIVIASNITQNVVDYNVTDMLSTILQAINIMMSEMSAQQLKAADVVITPDIGDVGTLDFTQKKRCMEAGIKASRGQVAKIKEAITRYYTERGGVPPGHLAAR